jgi:hypothetical protein
MFNFAASNSLNNPPALDKFVTQLNRERKTDMNEIENNPPQPEEDEQPSGASGGTTEEEGTADGRTPIPDSDPPIIIQGGG